MKERNSRTHYDELWKFRKCQFEKKDLERAEIILSMIPEDARSILEVGCGTSLIINQIRSIEAAGLDVSGEALTHVKHPSWQASVTDMPFPDRRWDAVIASEVLEHIPEEDYQKALLEIGRVCGRYIIISVPNNENLRKNLTMCPACRKVFNASYHFRRYSIKDMPRLFSGFELKSIFTAGESIRMPGNFELFVRQRIFEKYVRFEGTTCPECGLSIEPIGAAARTSDRRLRFYDVLKRLYFWAPFPKKYIDRWIFALYQRDASSRERRPS